MLEILGGSTQILLKTVERMIRLMPEKPVQSEILEEDSILSKFAYQNFVSGMSSLNIFKVIRNHPIKLFETVIRYCLEMALPLKEKSIVNIRLE